MANNGIETNICNCSSTVLKGLDLLISVTWVCHLVVAVWRGTWNLLDLYVLPGDMISGTWISYFGGIILCTSVNASYHILHRNIAPNQKMTRFILSHLMGYIATWALIGQWRGFWSILDRYMDVYWKSNALTFAVTLILLWILKASINTVVTPFVLQYDLKDDIFVSVPRLKTSSSKSWDNLVDHLLTQLIIQSLVTSLWRSLWNIFNDLVLPHQFLYSNLSTWIGGLILSSILLLLEKPLALLSVKCRTYSFGCKLVIENTYTLCCFVATVAIWRGWWNILEGILLQGKLFGGVICHCVGVTLLLCTSTSSTLYGLSCLVDGESKTGIHWPIKYLQLIFKNRVKPSKSKSDKREKNNNERDELFEESKNGDYIKCSPDFEFEDLKLTSV